MRKVIALFLFSLCSWGQGITLNPARMARAGANTGQSIMFTTVWGPGITGQSTSFTGQTTVTIAHPFNTFNIRVVCVSATNVHMQTKDQTASALGLVVIHFDTAKSGRCYVK